jgi:triphosphoribosyl-dephospho-CoA synthase
MKLAAERDLIAAQYANGFQQVFWGANLLRSPPVTHLDWEQAIILCYLEFMASYPDSLIARKCGGEEAREAARRAQRILAAEWPVSPESRQLLTEFDSWLRSPGPCRNPGTSADLVTASLFVTLRDSKFNPRPITSP